MTVRELRPHLCAGVSFSWNFTYPISGIVLTRVLNYTERVKSLFHVAINTITHWNSLWRHNYCSLKKDLYMKAQKAYTCRVYYVWFDPDVEAVVGRSGSL